MFYDLPFDVVGGVLGDWLELRSFVRVDSAVCDHSIRPVLLKMFATMDFTRKETVRFDSSSCVQWFSKRKMHVWRIALATSSAEMSKYLRMHSKNIWYAYCSGDDAVDQVAMDCRNLTYLVCENLMTKPNLNAALGYNAKLQHLRLECVKGLHLAQFEDVHLPHLKLLSLFGSKCNDALLNAIILTADEVQHLNIGKCAKITDEGLIAAAKHCPQLRSIGLVKLQLSDNALDTLTRLCPRIDNMQVSDNALITDLGVLSVARNLVELKSIDLVLCDKLTDLSLKYLVKHCALTLETLRAAGFQQVRVDALVRLLKKCHKLRSLVLDCDIHSYYADLVPHMRNLQTLLIDCLLSDDCLCLIAQHCKQLKKLGIPCTYKVDPAVAAAAQQSALEAGVGDVRVMYCAEEEATKNDVGFTDKGLLALMDGLPNLRLVLAPGVNGDSHGCELAQAVVQRLWQRLCPGLRFETDIEYFYLNVLNDGTL